MDGTAAVSIVLLVILGAAGLVFLWYGVARVAAKWSYQASLGRLRDAPWDPDLLRQALHAGRWYFRLANPTDPPGHAEKQLTADIEHVRSGATGERQCHGCKRVVKAKNEFCPYCATPLVRVCDLCDEVNVQDAKYCAQCGELLP